METPSSQRRYTRSQARLSHGVISAKEGTPAPSKPPGHSETTSIVKGGRRVLADIACNDSPIVGLVPALATAGTPSSNLKSAIGSRKSFFLEDASSGSTPIGENLLRSQVQILLQKVETDLHRAPALRTLCHINGFLDSPTRFAAPTPFNTPASCASICPEQSPLPVAIATTDAPPSNLVASDVKLCEASAAALLSKPDAVSPSNICQVDSPSNCQIIIAESVCTEREPRAIQTVPSDSKVIDAETTDLFLGNQITRTLQFDSPDKSAIIEKGSNLSCVISGPANSPSPFARELEDDEISQWSVVVNVSSPTSKHDESDMLAEAHQETDNIEMSTTCSVHEHLQKTREESNKLELLWSDQRRSSPYREGCKEEEEEEPAYEDNIEMSTTCPVHEHLQKTREESNKLELLWSDQRRSSPYREEGNEEEEEEEEAAYEDCFEEYYSDKEEEEDEYGEEHWENVECEDLCKSFRCMRVAEDGQRQGLPQAEGKHIRFLYDSDGEEIREEMIVERATTQTSPGTVHVRGLPTSRGVHLRFSEKEDEDSPTSN